MARNPKKSAAPKRAAKKRAAKHGGKVITKQDIEAAEAASQVPETIKLPGKNFIKKFVTETLTKMEAEMTSTRGDIGSAVNNAIEKNNVEKRALAIARRLHKMPDKKLQETMYHLHHYIEALGLWDRAKKQGNLDLEPAEEGEETESEETTAEEPAAGTDGTKSPQLKLVDAPPSEETEAA